MNELDAHDSRFALRAPDALHAFNQAGVLAAADVHVALGLARLGGERNQDVMLALAFAVRAPRMSEVCADLAAVAETATSELDVPVALDELPWPDVDAWIASVRGSPLVVTGDTGESWSDGGVGYRPLRLIGTRLYLDRYWNDERAVAGNLLARSEVPVHGVDTEVLASGLDRLFPGARDVLDLQRLACTVAVLRRFSVIAGGPGTGKTTTVARLLALLDEQAVATSRRPPRIALAAPTGKAAARLQEAVRQEAAKLDIDGPIRERLTALNASTLHRLLGWRPDSNSRFRHDGSNHLPHDAVIVDETSMVSLSLMARLVDAVRPDARLVLLGDPNQLASVEAGAVLGDIVGPAGAGLLMTPEGREKIDELSGDAPWDVSTSATSRLADGIVVLREVHRFSGAIAAVAEAIQRGDPDAVIDVLRGGHEIVWIDQDAAHPSILSEIEAIREPVVDAGRQVHESARRDDAVGALTALQAARVLCAHRRGPYGASHWATQVERWLRDAIRGYGTGGEWYVGRPLLLTANDHALRLYNGDTGVVVDSGNGVLRAVFERGGELVRLSPSRLDAVESVHAMTVHKSQGSQFGTVAVVLPDESSPLLTRELLYTAVTRAQSHLVVVGAEAAVREAVTHPISRASGLRERLWG